ncbi:hypothetical protein AMTRI_Chr11g153360 [Amborella trichopoda]
MVYQAPVKKKKKWSYFKKKITYYKRKKITSSFCLSKISSTISSCLFKSCPSLKNTQVTTSRALIRSTISSCLSKSCPNSGFLFLYKIVSFSPSIKSNEDQWFPCPSPVLNFFNTLTRKIIYSKDHNVLVHENIIGIIVRLPFYFMLLGLLLSYYGRKL